MRLQVRLVWAERGDDGVLILHCVELGAVLAKTHPEQQVVVLLPLAGVLDVLVVVTAGRVEVGAVVVVWVVTVAMVVPVVLLLTVVLVVLMVVDHP